LWLRVRSEPGGGKKTVHIDGAEFVGRFRQHVLPAGFKRICHYGLLAARQKGQRLAQARAALRPLAPNPIAQETAAEFLRRVARIDLEHCPHGHDRWRPIAQAAPPRTAPWPRFGRPMMIAARPQAPP
jgi:hypothetical protein